MKRAPVKQLAGGPTICNPNRPHFSPGQWQGVEMPSALGGYVCVVATDSRGKGAPRQKVVAEINADAALTDEQRANARALANSSRLYDLAFSLSIILAQVAELHPETVEAVGGGLFLEHAERVLADVERGELMQAADAPAGGEITVEERGRG
jgi:hypothetical protein